MSVRLSRRKEMRRRRATELAEIAEPVSRRLERILTLDPMAAITSLRSPLYGCFRVITIAA